MVSEGGERKTFALVLLCCASFVAVLDLTIVAIALPSIRRELGISGGDAQWILTGYALSFGGLLLLMGRAGDLYGRRRLFVSGLALFAAASLLGGLAWAPWVLVAARLLQGVGGAALVPASLALVAATFAEGEERNRAMGVYGAMAGVGFVFGMVLGGVITQFLGWRWVLLVNVPVALAVLSLAPVAIDESKDDAAPRTLDLAGAATATLGLASLIYAISEAPKNGWASPATLGTAGMGTVLLGVFVAHERRASTPLVALPILYRRAVAVPNLAVVLKSMVSAAQLYVLTLYFQDALDRTPLEAGLLFIPMTAASVVASPVAGRLTTRLGARRTAVWGFAMSGAGLVLVAWLMPQKDALVAILLGMAVAEAGFVSASVPLTVAATDGVGDNERGLASGVLSTATELGNALGFAAVGAVIAAATATGPVGADALLSGLRWGLWSATGFAVLALMLVVVSMGSSSRRQPEI
ncbi:MAG TPA: MFS transporter [Rubrobacter sp.]|nr:MFS transporter [Rubrobacter sp.]